MIDSLEPMLKRYTTIDAEYQMLNHLTDLDIQDDDELKSLGTKYSDISTRKEKIIESYDEIFPKLERLIAVIVNIHIDYHKLKGININQNSSKISEFVRNFDNEKLVNFILGGNSNDEIVQR